MDLAACRFETSRLGVVEWHDDSSRDLAGIVAEILVPDVTASLPPQWHGSYSRDRADEWIVEQDAEGSTFLVVERSSDRVVGLLLLGQYDAAGGLELRLGYLLARSSWGQGFASELVGGFVNWVRQQEGIASVAGGVADDNPASARVLEKNGFELSDVQGEVGTGESIWRLHL